jgi:Tfp pilus assembly pilus retraction ATPase PilT
MNIFNIADIYFNVNNSESELIDDSLIEMGYCTSLDSTKRHYRFRDLYKGDDSDRDLLKQFINIHSQAINTLKQQPEYKQDPDNADKIDFNVKYKINDEIINMRANYSFIHDGYCLNLRCKPPSHPYLEELDIPKSIKTILMSEKLNNGLVLFTAETGQGKTTTAVGAMTSRIKKYGGHGIALEDPPEYLIQGFHGDNGFITQTDVRREFAPYIENTLRKMPVTDGSILFVGEIRGPESAYQALLASAQGNLVLGTIHGMDIPSTFKRLITWMANRKGGSVEVAADMLSSSFRFIFHQQKTRNPKGEGWHKYLIDGDVFYALTKETKQSIERAIKDSKFELLTNLIERQNTFCQQFDNGEITEDKLTDA